MTTFTTITKTTAPRAAAMIVLVALASMLSACKPAPVEPATVAVAPLTAPTSNEDAPWRAYLTQQFQANQLGITDKQYAYYLPANSKEAGEDGSSQYARQLDNVSMVVARTVLPGNMLAFGSPDSTAMGDMIVEAFKEAKPEALKGSQVLFVGNAADKDRVKAAAEASGAKFVFVEAK